MSEYNMSHTGRELDDAINRVLSGYILPSGTKDITSNGTYDVKSFASANVNVAAAKLQEKTVEPEILGQTVKPDSGYDGLSQVTIEKLNLQAKYINPTKERQIIMPDVGYHGLSQAIVEPIPSDYIIPSGTLAITSNGTKDVKNYASVNVNVPAPKWKHTRIIKTTGSSDSTSFSIPLSEIGFTPKAYALTMYPASQISATTAPSHIEIISLACDMDTLSSTGASTSGAVFTTGKGISTVGISTKGEVSGNNFSFSGTYGYFRANTVYRFFFWGLE